jgi:hypothetical protein
MGRNKFTNNVLNANSQYFEIDRLTILFDRRPDLEFKKSKKILIFSEKIPGVRHIARPPSHHPYIQEGHTGRYIILASPGR